MKHPMFEYIFQSELSNITSNHNQVEELWEEIKSSYSKPARNYHNISHLDSLVSELLPIRERISDWLTVVFSIAYHDIIYNPLKGDNEEKSAIICQDRLSKLSISVTQIDKCFNQIIATKAHTLSVDQDTNFFTDADLSILAAAPDVYLNYTNMIRKEYKIFPDFVYRPGRIKVLQSFLNMQYIFKTEYFRDKYETQAIDNIKNEVKRLSK